MTRRRLIVSIDVERDIPRFLRESYDGVTDVLSGLVETICGCGFVADLFVEAPVARRFPHLIRGFSNRGHYVACHGEHLDPRFASQLSRSQLDSRLALGVQALQSVLGTVPRAFREANFAVNSRVFESLLKIGFRVDSSVLPNRLLRRWLLRKVVDHRGIESRPYLVPTDPQRQRTSLLEIPVSENPLNPGNPIGAGFLNREGVTKTLQALRNAQGEPVTFLVHPWECIDLAAKHKDLPGWVLRISRDNNRDLGKLLSLAAAEFEATTLPEIAAQNGVEVR